MDKSGLLSKYQEWSIRGGQQISNKYLSFLDIDIAKEGFALSLQNQLAKIVYGINYSEQIEDSNLASASDGFNKLSIQSANLGVKIMTLGSGSVRIPKKNNDKGSTIKLIGEINESSSLLGKKSDFETERYEKQYLQEIPPKQDYCIVM